MPLSGSCGAAVLQRWTRFRFSPCIARRGICSVDGKFDSHLQEDTIRQVEAYWKPRLQASIPQPKPDSPKYYVLSMFPYPSGKLHMGHVRVYSISDAFAHYYRMRGYNVIHPMGWDAFGLPAENAAIENNVSPKTWTEQNIIKMKEQLSDLGCIFDWDREIATCDPKYYKWTQFLFLKMYEAGLVYQKESIVNWDPVDQTVLADEQVDENGNSWRSGAKVEKKPLKQWFFRTTNFCQSLLDGLEDPSLVNWRDIVKAQQNWIGKATGTKIDWQIVEEGGENVVDTLTVWTDTPQFIMGTGFIVVHPDHILNTKHSTRLQAVNPLSGERVPVLVSNFLEFPYGSQTVLGLPAIHQKHRELATTYSISDSSPLTEETPDGRTVLVNSGQLNGLTLEEGRARVMQLARQLNIGGHPTSSNLQDWLISRQRYWGTPIPMIRCVSCGDLPVPEADLPVELPHLEGLSSKGLSPLLEAEDWLKVACPRCGEEARRETDTMDTFVDSSWYFLRYLDPHNSEEPFSQEAASNMPVDLYIGGKEHAYLHLYFARFFTHFLQSVGLVPGREPFSNLITQGMVKGKTYRIKGSTRYIKPEAAREVEGGRFVEEESGQPLVVEWDKMSKSKHNGVDPSLLIQKYGCDTVRLMMLSNVGPSTERNWSEDSYPGVRNLQIKLWKLVHQAVELPQQQLPELRYPGELEEYREKLRTARNNHLRHINYAYNHTRNLAVMIARVHSLVGAIWSVPGQVKRDAPEYQAILGAVLVLLAPVAPHLMCELWAGLQTAPVKLCHNFNWDKGLFEQPWPQVDPTFSLDLRITANGRELTSLPVAKWKFDTITGDEAFDLACHCQPIQEKVLPYDITATSFRKYEGYEAWLDITCNQVGGEPELSQDELREQRRAEKVRQKEEKAAKRARRARKIEEMAEVERRKASTSIPITKS